MAVEGIQDALFRWRERDRLNGGGRIVYFSRSIHPRSYRLLGFHVRCEIFAPH